MKRMMMYAAVCGAVTMMQPASGKDDPGIDHPWKGCCVAFLGDSITDPVHVGTTRNYWQDLGDWLGLDYTSFGQNGQVWNGVKGQAEKAKAKYGDRLDAIFVFMGTNDYMGGVPLGEWFVESECETIGFDGRPAKRLHRELNLDPATFRGRINVQLKYLKEEFPDQQIVLMTPIHRAFAQFGSGNVQQPESYANAIGKYVDEYVAAIREAGSIWSIPVIDLFAESGLHPLTPSHAKFFSNRERDLLHPNAAGHNRIARTIYAKLIALPPNFRGDPASFRRFRLVGFSPQGSMESDHIGACRARAKEEQGER